MTFKKVGKVEETGGQSNVDWEAFNAHLEQQVLEATEHGRSTNQVCFVSGIVDTGTQPPIEPYTIYDAAKEGDSNFDSQKKLMEADFGCFYKDNKFHIPQKPVDSVVLFVDFPDIKVDYGTYFGEDGEEFKPYRCLLAGEWDNVATYTALSPSSSGYGGKSRVSTLAKATGCTQNLPPANFDIGELLGKPFTMDVVTSRGGDKNQYLNIRVSNPSSKHRAIPTPEHDVIPFGIMMSGGNAEVDLKQICRKKNLIKRLELSSEWATSELKKEIEGIISASGSEGNTPPTPEPTKSAPEPDPTDSFDDDIPF